MRRIGAKWEGIEISEAEQIRENRLEKALLVEELEIEKRVTQESIHSIQETRK